MFRIGEFSKLVRVTPRMLRHYEKCGLVAPRHIDEFTGYRYYGADQMLDLSRITALRDMGFSVDEIKTTIPHFEDQPYMSRILHAKSEEVKRTISSEQEKLTKLAHMSGALLKERNIMLYDVETKALDPIKAITLRDRIPKYNQEGILWERLCAFVGENQIACTGGGYATYLDEEYMEENPDVEIALPVSELGENNGEFIYKEYPAIPLAATLKFSGAFDGGYDAASAKLASWVEQNGYEFAGPARGHVIVEPHSVSSPDDLLTELQAPIRKAE